MEGATGIDFAAGYDIGGPGEEVDGQQGVGGGGSGELDIGGGDEEAAFVEAIEGFAIERGNADAECGVAQGWVLQDKLNAVSELTGCWSGMREVSRGLGDETGRKNSGGEGEQEDSPQGIHAGKFSRRRGPFGVAFWNGYLEMAPDDRSRKTE